MWVFGTWCIRKIWVHFRGLSINLSEGVMCFPQHGDPVPPPPPQKIFVITIVVIVPLELLCNLYTRSAVSGACVYSSALACWPFTVLHSTCIQHCSIKLAVAGREAHLSH